MRTSSLAIVSIPLFFAVAAHAGSPAPALTTTAPVSTAKPLPALNLTKSQLPSSVAKLRGETILVKQSAAQRPGVLISKTQSVGGGPTTTTMTNIACPGGGTFSTSITATGSVQESGGSVTGSGTYLNVTTYSNCMLIDGSMMNGGPFRVSFTGSGTSGANGTMQYAAAQVTWQYEGNLQLVTASGLSVTMTFNNLRYALAVDATIMPGQTGDKLSYFVDGSLTENGTTITYNHQLAMLDPTTAGF